MNTPKPAVVDEAALDWEGWSDPATLAGRSATRWKILITGERTASRGLVTGIAQLAPGAQLQPHHHEPEETYYIVSGHGEMEIDDDTTAVGPGCAIYIPRFSSLVRKPLKICGLPFHYDHGPTSGPTTGPVWSRLGTYRYVHGCHGQDGSQRRSAGSTTGPLCLTDTRSAR